jgi:hypothetical protein
MLELLGPSKAEEIIDWREDTSRFALLYEIAVSRQDEFIRQIARFRFPLPPR